MPQWLAVEWDDEELRAVVAHAGRRGLTLEDAFCVPLGEAVPASEEEGARQRPSAEEIGRKLAAALAARGVSHPRAFVALSRSRIELRQLSLPPVADEELPDLVRFQALREFPQIDEDWRIDYIPVEAGTEPTRSVLAAALPPAGRAEIEAVCGTAGLSVARQVLRPCAAASLALRRVPGEPDEIRLIVNLVGEEADLAVVVREALVFVRTARVFGDPLRDPDAAELFVGEIRRTMVAAQNQLGGGRANRIVLCGADAAHQALGAMLGERLSLPLACFDPFDDAALSGELAKLRPDDTGRFASLVGVLADEADKRSPAIDFLHPKRRPEPPSRKNRYLLAGAAGLLLVLWGLIFAWMTVRGMDDKIRALQTKRQDLDRKLKEADKTRKLADALDAWRASDVLWLEELKRLNEKVPPAKEVMLNKLTLAAGERGGQITLEGFAAGAEAVQTLEQSLEDDAHRLISKGKAEDASQPPYTIRFGSVVVIRPPEAASGTPRAAAVRRTASPAARGTAEGRQP